MRTLINFNTINKEETMNLFSFVSRKMQEFIVGYIKVGNKYEPAVSENETFMPLSSFGISNTFISDKFIPFPDGKTLADMVKTPIEYQKWCDENLK